MTKTVLLTGASKGIGHCCALGLKERGYRVFATARKSEDLATLKAQGLEALSLDLNNSDSIQQLVVEIAQRTNNTLDFLVNNAGMGQVGAVEDLSREAIKNQFETNLFGPLELTNRIIPLMRRQGHGRIINISSVLGMVAMPYRGAYNASKFALEGLTDTLRLELAGSGIQVILIEPGPIESRFREQAYEGFKKTIDIQNSPHRTYYEKMLDHFDIENANNLPFTLPPAAVLTRLIHALESPRPKIRYYVTFPAYVLPFLKRILPARVLDWILKKI